MATMLKTSLHPSQLDSLLLLAAILPHNKLSVLGALIRYLQTGILESSATREQARPERGPLPQTICRHIEGFKQIELPR